MPIGQTIVQFERLLRRRSRFGQILSPVDKPATHKTPIDVGQIGVGERVTRIGGDRPSEVVARLLPVFRSSLRAMEMPFEKQFIRFRVARLGRRSTVRLTRGRVDEQLRGNVARDVRRHLKQIRWLADVLLAPHLRPVAAVDQLDANREAVASLRDSAGQDARDIQRAGDLLRIRVLAFVTG